MYLPFILDLVGNQLSAVCVLRVAGLGDDPLASTDEGGLGLTLGWEGPRSNASAERVSQRRECLAV